MTVTTSTSCRNNRRPHVVPQERSIAICLMIWVMIATMTTRVEALDVADIVPVLPPPVVLWQDAKALAEHRVLGDILQSLVQTGLDDDGFARRLGFASAAEVRGLVAGLPPSIKNPFAIIRVDLKRLQKFVPAQNPLELLLDDSNWFHTFIPIPPPNFPVYSPVRLLFPIMVGNVAKSSVLLRFSLNSGEWDVQQLGSPQLINRLTTCGTGLTGSSAPRCDGNTHFVVWIPALNRHYLGRIDTGIFKITAVFDEPNGFTAGQEREAKLVFELLKLQEAIHILPNTPPR